MVAVRPLVVVAGIDPVATDELADRLRETCVVRTAHTTDEVVDRLDAAVDVVLVAPRPDASAVRSVRRAVDEGGLPCRIGVLVGDDEQPDESALPAVDPAESDQAIRDAVERLAALAQYRRALDEYFALAREGSTSDPAASDARSERLDDVRERLDDAAADLDAASLFEAALYDPGDSGATGDGDDGSVSDGDPEGPGIPPE